MEKNTTPSKSDLIKTYGGHLILPFGTPSIITTAWETPSHYHFQSVAVLDCSDHSIRTVVQSQSFPKSVPAGFLPGSLPKKEGLGYCLKHGYNIAYKQIPELLWDYGYQKMKGSFNLPNVNAIEIKLWEQQDMELVILSHILKRDKAAFDALEGLAQSDILKDLMKTVKGYDAATENWYPKQE